MTTTSPLARWTPAKHSTILTIIVAPICLYFDSLFSRQPPIVNSMHRFIFPRFPEEQTKSLRLPGQFHGRKGSTPIDAVHIFCNLTAMTNKRVLITGGSGFLGSHLCERFLAKGHEVICVDNFFTGNKSNILHLLDNPYFEIIRHDVTFPLYVEVDEIYNLACPASPIHYQHDPVQTTKTSVHGAINMLGLAKRVKAKNLPGVHLRGLRRPRGSSANRRLLGQRQPHRPFVPAMTRASGALKRSVSITIANTISGSRSAASSTPTVRAWPWTTDAWSPTSWCRLSKAKILPCTAKASRPASFCYVDDLVEGIIRFTEDTPDDFIGPMNLGNPGEFTILQLAETVIDLVGSQSKIVFNPLPSDDPMQRKPDISLCKKSHRLGADCGPQIGADQNR